MKLLRSTKSEIHKETNEEKVSHLEITEVVLIHCNILNNNYQRVLYHLLFINRLVNYQIVHLKILYFKKLLMHNFHILKYGLLIKIINH